MTLHRIARAIDRILWHWRKPKPDPVVVSLNSRRVQLAMQHKPRRYIDKKIREHKTAQLRKEMGA